MPRIGTLAARVVFEPGNGTRYELVLLDLNAIPVSGTGDGDGYILVSRVNGSRTWAYPFRKGAYIDPGYLEQASGMGRADCEVLAPFLSEELGRW